jgi:SAM-dependent methyltransferase
MISSPNIGASELSRRAYTQPMPALYETIGQTYAVTRQPDPRIAAQIIRALGTANSVLNVGAGAGNYEPTDRDVVALDPSFTMLKQRHESLGPAACGVAERLPFRDNCFDVAMGTLTLHHWPDLAAGLGEVRRVARKQVFLTYEPSFAHRMWIIEYFPEIMDLPHEKRAPSADDLREFLDITDVQVVPVPHDCIDGFGGAYWARPDIYLQPEVQSGMSMLAVLDPSARERGTQRLRESLASGDWDRRYGHLRTEAETDLGYRLVVAG